MKTRNVRRKQAIRWKRWWMKNAKDHWLLPLSVEAGYHNVSMRKLRS